jgi:hypothetical protein
MFKSKSNLKGCYANPNMDNGLGETGSCVRQDLINGMVPVGGCSSSDGSAGYRNTTGFPKCCVENPSDACKNLNKVVEKTANVVDKVVEKTGDVVDKVVEKTTNVVKAAKNCVAKNPNYPSEIGGCVYNPNNPCPSKYEITDSRFGIKMCCDPMNENNLDCYKSKSGFGSSSSDNSFVMILLFLLVVGLIYYLKRSKGSMFGRRRR